MPDFYIYYQEGTANGPYNVYLSGSSGLTLYGTGVTQAQMDAGYVISLPSGFTSSSVVVYNMAYGCSTEDRIPFPTPTLSPTPTISVTPSKTPSISVTPSKTPSVSISPTATPSITPPPSNTPSITPSITPSQTPGISISPTPSITISATPSVTPSQASNALYIGVKAQEYTSANAACLAYSTEAGFPYYIIGGESLGNGTVLYSDSTCFVPVIGDDKWIALSYLGIGPIISVVQVDNYGVISNANICP
jgi:hypothetical protein